MALVDFVENFPYLGRYVLGISRVDMSVRVCAGECRGIIIRNSSKGSGDRDGRNDFRTQWTVSVNEEGAAKLTWYVLKRQYLSHSVGLFGSSHVQRSSKI